MSATTHRATRGRGAIREQRGIPLAARRRRAWVLVLLTLVLPGSAQVVAGNRTAGRVALRTVAGVLGCAALAGLLFWLDRGLALSLFTRTPVLWLLSAALVVLAVGWALLFLDAWRLARPLRLGSAVARGVTGLTAGLVLLTAGPLLYGAHLVDAQRGLIASVFADGGGAGTVDGRYNVLLLGGDAGDDRYGLRPDSINLVSVDAETGSAVQIGVPRNLVGVPFPSGSPLREEFPGGFDADEGMVNAVYQYGAEHPDLYPGAADPGAEAMKDAVEGVTGLEVQYYVIVDMLGFEALVDALGGVEVDVTTRVPKAAITDSRAEEFIEPGLQRLGGADALWFARSRFDTTDYDRMTRQRCVMTAMLRQMDPQTVLLRFQDIAAAGGQVVRTDVPESQLGGLLDLALRTRSQPVSTVQLVPPAIDTGDPDFDVARQLVADSVDPSEGEEEQAAVMPAPPPSDPDAEVPAPGQSVDPDAGTAPATEACTS